MLLSLSTALMCVLLDHKYLILRYKEDLHSYLQLVDDEQDDDDDEVLEDDWRMTLSVLMKVQ